MKSILSTTALAFTLALAPDARSTAVIVIENAAIVDTVGGSSSESDTIQPSLTLLSHTVSTFTATNAAGITAARPARASWCFRSRREATSATHSTRAPVKRCVTSFSPVEGW